MTDNKDNSKSMHLILSNQFLDVETMHSLTKVAEDIQQTIDVVDTYKRKVEKLQPPIVNGRPWYKFDFGKASVEEVNKVMENFSTFVQDTFKLVATSQNFQNENDMNICRLLGLLAIAEAKSYSKLQDLSSEIKELSTEDEESAKQLEILQNSFLNSLNESAEESIKKEEQMSRLIDYVTLFAETKTRKLRSITLNLSEVKKKLDEYCFSHDKWAEDMQKTVSSWQDKVSKGLSEENKQLEDSIKDITATKLSQIDENYEQLKTRIQKRYEEQETKLTHEVERQKIEIKEFLKSSNDKMIDFKSAIEKQTRIIEDQNNSIITLVNQVSALDKKYKYALIASTISIILSVGCVVFTLIA